MRKYKVLKEFVSSDGGYIHKEGSEYKPTKSASRTANLERLGYIEEKPEQPKTVWDLKDEDVFFVIEGGMVGGGLWENYDYRRERGAGDVFLTKEEAEKELTRRKAKQILLRDTKGFVPFYGKDVPTRYCVLYDIEAEKLLISSPPHWMAEDRLYFATREDAEASIEKHKKEWLVYLGVEE